MSFQDRLQQLRKRAGIAEPRRDLVYKTGEALLQLAQVAVHVRPGPGGRLPLLQSAALGLTAANTVQQLWQTWRVPQDQNYFSSFPGSWNLVSPTTSALACGMFNVTDVEALPGFEAFDDNGSRFGPWRGRHHGFPIGWIGGAHMPGRDFPNLVLLSDDCEERLRYSHAVGRAALEREGIRHAEFADGGTRDVTSESQNKIVRTSAIDALVRRAEAFYRRGVQNSILLWGVPGTGKTTAARAIADALGLTSVTSDATSTQRPAPPADRPTITPNSFELQSGTGRVTNTEIQDLRVLLKVVPFDVVIVNDLDHLHASYQPGMLSTLEFVRANSKILVVTANKPDRIIPEILRPGRVDEKFEVRGVTPVEVRAVLGHLELPEHYLEAVVDWPMAYVQQLRQVLETVGVDAAEIELARLDEARKISQR